MTTRLTDTQASSSSAADATDTTYVSSNINLKKERRKFLRCKSLEKNLIRPWNQLINVIDSFTVMTYNILADSLVHHDLYRFCPPWALQWSYRRIRILAEIQQLRPDIICLQEVDHDAYHYFFLSKLNSDYRGHFQQRSGDKLDGCAVFYRKSLFKLISLTCVDYHRELHDNRNNVAIIVILKHNASNKAICVVTTHLLYNPSRGIVKLNQLKCLFQKIKQIESYYEETIPIVLCGDFNITPGCSIYKFITTGCLRFRKESDKSLSGQTEAKWKPPKYINLIEKPWIHWSPYTSMNLVVHATIKFVEQEHIFSHDDKQSQTEIALQSSYPSLLKTSEDKECEFHHDFPFSSVYKHHDRDGRDEVSTYHSDFCGTVDYIFYTPSTLRCTGFLELHSVDVLEKMKGLPNPYFPSDHVSLLAQFMVCK